MLISIMTLFMMIHIIMTLSITTLSITTLSIMKQSLIILSTITFRKVKLCMTTLSITINNARLRFMIRDLMLSFVILNDDTGVEKINNN
jgi:hypothetical protein